MKEGCNYRQFIMSISSKTLQNKQTNIYFTWNGICFIYQFYTKPNMLGPGPGMSVCVYC